LLDVNPAAQLEAKGARETAERGPDYHRQIVAKRKSQRWERPRKKIAT